MIILFTIILFENWNRANIDKHVDDFQLQADENGGPQLMGAEESSGEPLPPEETSKTEEPTTQELTTTEAGTTEATTQELTTEAKTQELTTEAKTQELTTIEITTEEPTTETESQSPEPTPFPPTTLPASSSPPPTENLTVHPPKSTPPPSISPDPTPTYDPDLPPPSTPLPSDSPTQSDTPSRTKIPPPPAPTPPSVVPPSTPPDLYVPPTPQPPPVNTCPLHSNYTISQCLYETNITDFCQYGLLENDITDKHQFDLVSAKFEFDYSTTQTFNFDYFYYNLTLVGRTELFPTEIHQSHVGESNIQNHLELNNVNFLLSSPATINTLFLFKKSLISSHDNFASDFTNLSDSSLIVFDNTTVGQSYYMRFRPISKGFSYDVVDDFVEEIFVYPYSISFTSHNNNVYSIHTRGMEKEIYLRMYPPSNNESLITIRLHIDYLKIAFNPVTFRLILLSEPKGKINVYVKFEEKPSSDFKLNLIVESFEENSSITETNWYLSDQSTFYELDDGAVVFSSSIGLYHMLGCPTVVPPPSILDDDGAKATGFIIALPFILIVVLACLIVLICYCKRYSNSAKEDSSDDDSYDMDSSTVES